MKLFRNSEAKIIPVSIIPVSNLSCDKHFVAHFPGIQTLRTGNPQRARSTPGFVLQVRLIESMMGLRPRQGNLRLVFILFSLMRGLPSIRLK